MQMDLSTFFSTFGLVFVAELGDKTQLAVMTQTCKYRTTWPVFLGGSLALTAVTALGALGGQLLNHFIPAEFIRLGVALAFVAMGLFIWREAGKPLVAPAEDPCREAAASSAAPKRWDWRAFTTTLGLLFFAELGDKTQLAVIGLAGKQPTLWPVFLGGSLALTAVTALGVLGGQALARRVPERLLLQISAVAFVVMGVLMGIGIL